MDVRSDNRCHVTDGRDRDQASMSRSIDWYAEGQAREMDVAGQRMTVKFVGRKGRRARIAISGPAGAVFRDLA